MPTRSKLGSTKLSAGTQKASEAATRKAGGKSPRIAKQFPSVHRGSAVQTNKKGDSRVTGVGTGFNSTPQSFLKSGNGGRSGKLPRPSQTRKSSRGR
jgi:hypothetical protein